MKAVVTHKPTGKRYEFDLDKEPERVLDKAIYQAVTEKKNVTVSFGMSGDLVVLYSDLVIEGETIND